MDIVALNELIPNIVDEIMLYFAFHPDLPSEDIGKKIQLHFLNFCRKNTRQIIPHMLSNSYSSANHFAK